MFNHSLNYSTALASVRLLNDASIMDLTSDDYDFLTSQGAYKDKLWLPIDRTRARRSVESVVYGALDMLGYPRFPAPVEFVAAAIARYVHPVNIQTACAVMEGLEYADNVIHGIENPIKAPVLFAHVLRILAGIERSVEIQEEIVQSNPMTRRVDTPANRKE